jgi:hypothetical protein
MLCVGLLERKIINRAARRFITISYPSIYNYRGNCQVPTHWSSLCEFVPTVTMSMGYERFIRPIVAHLRASSSRSKDRNYWRLRQTMRADFFLQDMYSANMVCFRCVLCRTVLCTFWIKTEHNVRHFLDSIRRTFPPPSRRFPSHYSSICDL